MLAIYSLLSLIWAFLLLSLCHGIKSSFYSFTVLFIFQITLSTLSVPKDKNTVKSRFLLSAWTKKIFKFFFFFLKKKKKKKKKQKAKRLKDILGLPLFFFVHYYTELQMQLLTDESMRRSKYLNFKKNCSTPRAMNISLLSICIFAYDKLFSYQRTLCIGKFMPRLSLSRFSLFWPYDKFLSISSELATTE